MNPASPRPLLLLALFAGMVASASASHASGQATLERGRYLVAISSCNDCHTPGYAESAGATAQADWLTGSPVGFQGPWGTTYPANLRLLVQGLSEQAWLKLARTPMRPPMPWFAMRDMSDADLRAMYRYIRSLGGKGAPAPAYAPPGEKVATPYFDFVPKNLPPQAHAAK